jgi:hypothetical protein
MNFEKLKQYPLLEATDPLKPSPEFHVVHATQQSICHHKIMENNPLIANNNSYYLE